MDPSLKGVSMISTLFNSHVSKLPNEKYNYIFPFFTIIIILDLKN